jgi:RNA polymerase sigma factor (sigma-70 family)
MTFEQLYTTHSRQVYNLSLHYVQNSHDAQEITQDVFLSVHQSIDHFRLEANYSTWIYRITVNKSLDFLKVKKRKKRFAFFTEFSAKNEPVHFDHPGVLLEFKEETKQLFSYIDGLPDAQKTALILNKIEHKSQGEIA